jgi:mannan endo-1,4-beta-mannosidase
MKKCFEFSISAMIIILVTFSSVFGAADPLAVQKAKDILSYITALPSGSEKRIVSGQFGWDQSEVEQIVKGLGKYPAMIGRDYVDFRDVTGPNAQLIDHWNAGGLVTMTYHMKNPKTNGSPWDTTSVDLGRVVQSGTTENTNFKTELDRLAGGLTQLRDAGVVVLYRPLHEMNGSWFWWGGKSAAQFTTLWTYIFNYLTTTKGLHNLLFGYTPNESLDMTYYPGSQYVDFVGVDMYGHGGTVPKVSGYDSLPSIGKPFAITEIGLCAGGLTDDTSACPPQDISGIITSIKSNMPKTVFWLSWNGVYSIPYNRNWTQLMADPWVITRDELNISTGNSGKPPRTPQNLGVISQKSSTIYPRNGNSIYRYARGVYVKAG